MSGEDKRMGERKDKNGKEADKERPPAPISSGGPIQEEEHVGMSSPEQLPPSIQPKEARTITIGNITVPQGTTSHLKVKISESFTSQPVHIPISVINGAHPGPTMFISAALHGDELNGVEVVRRLIYEVDLAQLHGALVLIPVVNVLGFESSSRYLPDRRDLNRVFPGNPTGPAAERIADKIYNIAVRCNFAIDLHTASIGRFNMPHVRADMSNAEARKMAKAFGTEIIMDHPGVKHSLRYNLTENKVPSILLEAGQSNRFEPAMVQVGLQGVLNVLYELGMLKGEKKEPLFRVIVHTTEWVRVERGGLLDLRIKPRTIVSEGDILAFVENPFGKEREVVKAPFAGMVVGVATNPLVFPGGPVCHLVKIDKALEKVKGVLAVSAGIAPVQPAHPVKERTEGKVGQPFGE